MEPLRQAVVTERLRGAGGAMCWGSWVASSMVSSAWGETRGGGVKRQNGCPAGKQAKGSGPELHGHDLSRLEGRSTVTARWGLGGLSPLFHLQVQLTL